MKLENPLFPEGVLDAHQIQPVDKQREKIVEVVNRRTADYRNTPIYRRFMPAEQMLFPNEESGDGNQVLVHSFMPANADGVTLHPEALHWRTGLAQECRGEVQRTINNNGLVVLVDPNEDEGVQWQHRVSRDAYVPMMEEARQADNFAEEWGRFQAEIRTMVTDGRSFDKPVIVGPVTSEQMSQMDFSDIGSRMKRVLKQSGASGQYGKHQVVEMKGPSREDLNGVVYRYADQVTLEVARQIIKKLNKPPHEHWQTDIYEMGDVTYSQVVRWYKGVLPKPMARHDLDRLVWGEESETVQKSQEEAAVAIVRLMLMSALQTGVAVNIYAPDTNNDGGAGRGKSVFVDRAMQHVKQRFIRLIGYNPNTLATYGRAGDHLVTQDISGAVSGSNGERAFSILTMLDDLDRPSLEDKPSFNYAEPAIVLAQSEADLALVTTNNPDEVSAPKVRAGLARRRERAQSMLGVLVNAPFPGKDYMDILD